MNKNVLVEKIIKATTWGPGHNILPPVVALRRLLRGYWYEFWANSYVFEVRFGIFWTEPVASEIGAYIIL